MLKAVALLALAGCSVGVEPGEPGELTLPQETRPPLPRIPVCSPELADIWLGREAQPDGVYYTVVRWRLRNAGAGRCQGLRTDASFTYSYEDQTIDDPGSGYVGPVTLNAGSTIGTFASGFYFIWDEETARELNCRVGVHVEYPPLAIAPSNRVHRYLAGGPCYP